MGNFSGLLFALLAHGPELIGEVEQDWTTIAHGEGGLVKIVNVIESLTHLFNGARNAVQSASAASAVAASPVADTLGPGAGSLSTG